MGLGRSDYPTDQEDLSSLLCDTHQGPGLRAQRWQWLGSPHSFRARQDPVASEGPRKVQEQIWAPERLHCRLQRVSVAQPCPLQERVPCPKKFSEGSLGRAPGSSWTCLGEGARIPALARSLDHKPQPPLLMVWSSKTSNFGWALHFRSCLVRPQGGSC